MSKIHAAVTAVHGYVPDYILTNQELETMVDTNDEWITTRTGIKERRILKGEGKATSDMAVPAVNGLLEKRGIGAEEIDLIIFCTVTPDMPFPATANILAEDRKSVVSGKSVSVRVDLGGGRIIKKTKKQQKK